MGNTENENRNQKDKTLLDVTSFLAILCHSKLSKNIVCTITYLFTVCGNGNIIEVAEITWIMFQCFNDMNPWPISEDLFRPFIGYKDIRVVHKEPRRVSVLIKNFLLIILGGTNNVGVSWFNL